MFQLLCIAATLAIGGAQNALWQLGNQAVPVVQNQVGQMPVVQGQAAPNQGVLTSQQWSQPFIPRMQNNQQIPPSSSLPLPPPPATAPMPFPFGLMLVPNQPPQQQQPVFQAQFQPQQQPVFQAPAPVPQPQFQLQPQIQVQPARNPPALVPLSQTIVQAPPPPAPVPARPQVFQIFELPGASAAFSPSLVCGDTMKYYIAADQIQFYTCCGQTIMNVRTMSCIKGSNGQDMTVPIVAPAPPPPAPSTQVAQQTLPQASNTATLSCAGILYTVQVGATNPYRCCGASLFDFTKSQCINGGVSSSAPSLPEPLAGQQQGGIVCQPGYTCCDSGSPVWDPARIYRCCPGQGAFNPGDYTCVQS